MNVIEILVCAAVVAALILELFPRLADAAAHACFVVYVTVAAWPMYLVLLAWRLRATTGTARH